MLVDSGRGAAVAGKLQHTSNGGEKLRRVEKSYETFRQIEKLLNSSHASSRDRKNASERDFRGGGLATHGHRFLFLSSFPFELRVITL